jgi:Domain of unknown function (DUF6894)
LEDAFGENRLTIDTPIINLLASSVRVATTSFGQDRSATSQFRHNGSNTHALGFRVQGGEHAVPRYFFHIKDGQVTILDQEGIELDNPAQAEAAQRAQKIVADQALNGAPVSSRASGSWCRR